MKAMKYRCMAYSNAVKRERTPSCKERYDKEIVQTVNGIQVTIPLCNPCFDLYTLGRHTYAIPDASGDPINTAGPQYHPSGDIL